MSFNSTALQVRFALTQATADLIWPEEKSDFGRRDELWKTTCFELFVGGRDRKNYFEINLSPSGDWNLYGFDDYRQGLKTGEPAQVSIRSTTRLSLEAEVGCESLIRLLTQPCQIGATTVLDWGSQKTEYWALMHSGNKPDFHRRSDWLWSV